MIKVYVVEDSRFVQFALGELLAVLGGFRVVGTAVGESEATGWLLENPDAWDLAITDLFLKEGSGFNLIPRFKGQRPAASVIVLSDFATPGVRTRCCALGADGAFMKHDANGLTEYLLRLRNSGQISASGLDASRG